MARTHCFDNTTGYVILSATGVCLIHRVELGTTALNLEGIRPDYLTNKAYVRLSREDSFQRDGCTASSQQNMTTQIQVPDPQFDDSST